MVYKTGKYNVNSDALRYLAILSKEEEEVDPEDGGRVTILDHLKAPLITERQVER